MNPAVDQLQVEDFEALGIAKRTAQSYLSESPKSFRAVPAYRLRAIVAKREDEGRTLVEGTLLGWIHQLEYVARKAGRF